MNIRKWVPVFLALALAGCGGGGQIYPDTDVSEIPGFELKVATGVQKDRGTMQAGTLEYSGQGDLVAIFRNYIAAMKGHGWHSRSEEVTSDKAVASLVKELRNCSLQFTQAQGTIRAVIKISPAK